MSPFCAAQCSAVMPSACAVLTSAPSFKSDRTASRLPLIAASTTEPPPAAAWMIRPDSGSAARAPRHRMLISVLRIVVSMCRGGPACPPGPTTWVGPYTSLPLRVRQYDLWVVEIELAAAVAEALEIAAAETVQHREHGVRHRRAVGRLDVDAALKLPAQVPGGDQRHALVVVDVRVAHRRPVQHEALVEQVAVGLGRVLQLLE